MAHGLAIGNTRNQTASSGYLSLVTVLWGLPNAGRKETLRAACNAYGQDNGWAPTPSLHTLLPDRYHLIENLPENELSLIRHVILRLVI